MAIQTYGFEIYLKETIGFVSIIGLLFILYCYIFLKDFRSFEFKLIVFLSIAALLVDLSNMIYIGDYKNDERDSSFICQFQAFLMLTFDLSLVSCGTNISLNLFLSCFKMVKERKKRKIIFWTVIFNCVLFPIIFALVIFLLDGLGFNVDYCFIKYYNNNNFYIMIGYTFIFIQVTLNIILTFCIFFKKDIPEFDQIYINSTIGFCITSFICWTPITIFRLTQGVENADATFHYVLRIIGDNFYISQGFVYSLIVIFNKEVREAIKHHLSYDGLFGIKATRCCCCCKKYKTRSETISTDIRRQIFYEEHNDSVSLSNTRNNSVTSSNNALEFKKGLLQSNDDDRIL